MLVDNQFVTLNWHPRNKSRLESLGYEYTGIGTSVLVKLEDVSRGSKVCVRVVCDYCGKEYTKKYKDYWSQHSNDCDCCIDCVVKKRIETDRIRYGGASPACSKDVVDKARKTMVERYGVERALQVPEFLEKSKNTLIKNYGVESPAKSPAIMSKILSSCYKNGTTPSSVPQMGVFNILQKIYGGDCVKYNYPVENVACDCLVSHRGFLIDVEYDGKYWHQAREVQDRRRNYFLTKRGYKVLRIKANDKDSLPDERSIVDAIDYLVKGNHSLAYIDMNI